MASGEHPFAVDTGAQCLVPYQAALGRLLKENETWLMQRILYYAKQNGYAQQMPALPEAWRLSIAGLTTSILAGIEHYRNVPELGSDACSSDDPVARFGVAEAQRHRARGVRLAAFLALFKYYEQTYVDLLERALLADQERTLCVQFVRRVMARVEIALCAEWTSQSSDHAVSELQSANRALMNEKNAFLTAFESLRTPVILLDSEGRITTLNHEASRLVRGSVAPGAGYYADGGTRAARGARGQPVRALFPWLPATEDLLDEAAPVDTFECSAVLDGSETAFEGRVSRWLDVSERAIGIVIVLNDVTEHKEMTERLDRLARTDGLTGTNNRRSFLELAKNEVRRAHRHGRELSVLGIDVDHFKRFNDQYGHEAGDQVLVAVTRSIQATLRATDTLGRLGGEEFAILLPETSLSAAVTAGERVRSAIASMRVRTLSGLLQVTASVGTATLTPDDHGFEELFRRADRALYRAKAMGRNRVVAAQTSEEQAETDTGADEVGEARRETRSEGDIDERRACGGRGEAVKCNT